MPISDRQCSYCLRPVQLKAAWSNVLAPPDSKYFVCTRFCEMEDRAVARVEPMTEAAEWRTRPLDQAHNVAVEVAQLMEQLARSPKVVVIQSNDWHG